MGDSYYEYLLKVRLRGTVVMQHLLTRHRSTAGSDFVLNLVLTSSLSCRRARQVWLLKGKKDDMYRAMWEKAMDEVAAQLIFSKGGLTYIAELNKCARLRCCTACCRNDNIRNYVQQSRWYARSGIASPDAGTIEVNISLRACLQRSPVPQDGPPGVLYAGDASARRQVRRRHGREGRAVHAAGPQPDGDVLPDVCAAADRWGHAII